MLNLKEAMKTITKLLPNMTPKTMPITLSELHSLNATSAAEIAAKTIRREQILITPEWLNGDVILRAESTALAEEIGSLEASFAARDTARAELEAEFRKEQDRISAMQGGVGLCLGQALTLEILGEPRQSRECLAAKQELARLEALRELQKSALAVAQEKAEQAKAERDAHAASEGYIRGEAEAVRIAGQIRATEADALREVEDVKTGKARVAAQIAGFQQIVHNETAKANRSRVQEAHSLATSYAELVSIHTSALDAVKRAENAIRDTARRANLSLPPGDRSPDFPTG